MSQADLAPAEDLNGIISGDNENPPVGHPQKRAVRGAKKSVSQQDSLPIEEALKTELTGTNNMKTPISVLQELLSRRGITPQYDLIQVEGAVHEPTFRYRVSYQDKDGKALLRTKVVIMVWVLLFIHFFSHGNGQVQKRSQTRCR